MTLHLTKTIAFRFNSGRSISQDGRRDLDRIAMTLIEQDDE